MPDLPASPTRPTPSGDKTLVPRRAAAAIACHRRFIGQDYLPQPAIWKIADAYTTIYLFGTVHQLPYDFEWRTPQFERIAAEARLLIAETGLPTIVADRPALPIQQPDRRRFRR